MHLAVKDPTQPLHLPRFGGTPEKVGLLLYCAFSVNSVVPTVAGTTAHAGYLGGHQALVVVTIATTGMKKF